MDGMDIGWVGFFEGGEGMWGCGGMGLRGGFRGRRGYVGGWVVIGLIWLFCLFGYFPTPPLFQPPLSFSRI